MSNVIDSALVLKDLVVGGGTAQEPSQQKGIGAGNDLLHGSVDVSGVVHIGAEAFDKGESTLMVATSSKQTGKRALHVKGNATIDGDDDYPLRVNGNVFVNFGDIGDLQSRFDTADGRPKPFDMVHPSKGKGNRLRYACIEGPEVAVYYRGRLKDSNIIQLPSHWKDLVHADSITVQIQNIGVPQMITVESFDNEKIVLESNTIPETPIDCFYHVYGERKDVNHLVVEYEGDTWEDYPDPDYDDPQYKTGVNTKTT